MLKLVNIWQSYQQKTWLSRALSSSFSSAVAHEVREATTFLLVPLPIIYQFYFFTERLSNKP